MIICNQLNLLEIKDILQLSKVISVLEVLHLIPELSNMNRRLGGIDNLLIILCSQAQPDSLIKTLTYSEPREPPKSSRSPLKMRKTLDRDSPILFLDPMSWEMMWQHLNNMTEVCTIQSPQDRKVTGRVTYSPGQGKTQQIEKCWQREMQARLASGVMMEAGILIKRRAISPVPSANRPRRRNSQIPLLTRGR